MPSTIRCTIILCNAPKSKEYHMEIWDTRGSHSHSLGKGKQETDFPLWNREQGGVHVSSFWLGKEKKNRSPWECELSADTASAPPVWHKKTSSREFNLKWSQIGSVPRWLSQVNKNPQILSGRTGLESRLTAPQTCRQLYNALQFQGH